VAAATDLECMDVTDLVFVSLMADNATTFYRALASYLERHLHIAIRVEETLPWQQRQQMLLRGDAHLGVMCGLQYVVAADEGAQPGVKLLVAPIMCGHRYASRPVYFSDVVVRSDSFIRSFADLRGAAWAYNEPTSQSGYNITRYTLATRGETGAYFSRVVFAGSHQRSLALVLDGSVDAAAIDSVVLERELHERVGLAQRLRVVDTFGPSPSPPVVVSRRVTDTIRKALSLILRDLHLAPEGSALLASGGVQRFVPVVDSDYDPIRSMALVAKSVRLM
jgi:phosphonate transport system substrate-binding protein